MKGAKVALSKRGTYSTLVLTSKGVDVFKYDKCVWTKRHVGKAYELKEYTQAMNGIQYNLQVDIWI